MDTAMPLTAADVAAVTRNNGYGCGDGMGFGGGNGWWTIILFAMIFGWGGNGFGGRGNFVGENPVTESALCNSMNFNNLENAVGRISDSLSSGLCNIGYQNLQNTASLQRDLCQGLTSVVASINAAAAQQAQCCCDTKQLLMENRYLAERNAANSDAVTVAQTQKILDAICGNRMADMQNQINQLQLQNAVAGVVRYPTSTTFATGCNPFFGAWGCGGCNCGNNNI